MENGVSLMGGTRMMKSMFAVPQGSNRFSALSLKRHGGRALNNEKPLKYFRHCVSDVYCTIVVVPSDGSEAASGHLMLDSGSKDRGYSL